MTGSSIGSSMISSGSSGSGSSNCSGGGGGAVAWNVAGCSLLNRFHGIAFTAKNASRWIASAIARNGARDIQSYKTSLNVCSCSHTFGREDSIWMFEKSSWGLIAEARFGGK